MPYLPHWPIPTSLGGRKIDSETVFQRMQIVLEKLENPHQNLPATIHVTGTNGKGSVITFLAKILEQADQKIDIFTSPHLHNCNERIVLGGQKISDNYLYEIMEEARIAADKTPLTFFEGFCIGTFLAFAKSNSDILLMETGMGARIDATNIIDKKLATIITPISFDHQEYLGNTIEEIALEKSYIIRPQTPVIIAPQPKQAQKIIEAIALEKNCEIIRYGQEFEIIKDDSSDNFHFRFFDQIFENLPAPKLLGDHQYINAATAFACALILDLEITQQHLQQTLQESFWPSRIEKITNNLNKLLQNKNSEIYIDGAHNQGGAYALANWISSTKKPAQKTFVIVGFSRDKCKPEFLSNFNNIADEIISIRVDGEPNPESAQKITEIAQSINMKIRPENNLYDAIFYAAKQAGTDKCKIIICGSLHLTRDVKKFGQ